MVMMMFRPPSLIPIWGHSFIDYINNVTIKSDLLCFVYPYGQIWPSFPSDNIHCRVPQYQFIVFVLIFCIPDKLIPDFTPY
jgi:hypothetical protein